MRVIRRQPEVRHWIITAPDTGNDKWAVRLANCDEAHATSVFEQLQADASVPDALVLTEVENLYDEPPHRSFLRTLIRAN
jgi:hypothetical protein